VYFDLLSKEINKDPDEREFRKTVVLRLQRKGKTWWFICYLKLKAERSASAFGRG
jgi:hypothetical protein